ncbi:MAG TPA: 2-dehydropantoate 2-reductase [Usitatibacter sp.]|nr:2-dehydropantoate 2-reductase [Usitatibacter sp.]
MKTLVLGAGGIGGYFGGRLAEAGRDVTFLVRPGRREQLARDGLVIESVNGNAKLPVKTVLAGELKPGYDVILFTCKAYDLDSAMDAIAPAVTGDAAIVPLLNGLAHFDTLDARFGGARVMGGTAQINAMLRKDGTVVNGDALHRIIFGERDKRETERAKALAAEFAGTKCDAKLSPDIVQELWEKIVFLSALAAATCLFRGNVREIMAAPGGREAMLRLLEANTEIATKAGRPPRDAVIKSATERLTDPAGEWSASMMRDMEAGNRVEADHIVGWMLAKAREYGVDDAMLSAAYTHLKTYEARRAAGRLPKG